MESFGGLQGTKCLQKADGEYVTIVGSAHAGFNMSSKIRELLEKQSQDSWFHSAPEVVAIEFGQFRMEKQLDPETRQKAVLAPVLNGAPVVRCTRPIAMLNTLTVIPAAFVLSALSGDNYGEDMYLTAHYVAHQMPQTRLVCIDRDQFVTMARWEMSLSDIISMRYALKLMAGLVCYRRDWIASALRQWSEETASELAPYLSPPLNRRLLQFDRILVDAYQNQQMSDEDFEQAKGCTIAATTAAIFAARNGCPQKVTGLHPALVQERDKILSYNLYNLKGKNAVAVVGLGHLDGIEQHWGKVSEEEVKELLKPPPYFTLKTCILPGLAAAASFGGLVYLHRRKILPMRVTTGVILGVAAFGSFVGSRAVTEVRSLVNVVKDTRQRIEGS